MTREDLKEEILKSVDETIDELIDDFEKETMTVEELASEIIIVMASNKLVNKRLTNNN